EVVVLATDAEALLAVDGPHVRTALVAEEHLFELHHAGVGEEQARVVLRDQGRARHDGVPALLEEIQERLTDLIPGHFRSCTGSGWRQQPRPDEPFRGGPFGTQARPTRSGLRPPAAAGVPGPGGRSTAAGTDPRRSEAPSPLAHEDSARASAIAEAQTCSLAKFFLDTTRRNGLSECLGGVPRRCLVVRLREKRGDNPCSTSASTSSCPTRTSSCSFAAAASWRPIGSIAARSTTSSRCATSFRPARPRAARN